MNLSADAAFIVLLPSFDEAQGAIISDIRKKYDTLHQKMPPHITLVYPQSLYSPAELDLLLSSVAAATRPICISLDKLWLKHEDRESYLFLSPSKKTEAENIHALHETLYRNGNLKSTLQADTYAVHMTIGRFKNTRSASEALLDSRQNFQPVIATINDIAVIHRKRDERLIFSKYKLGSGLLKKAGQ